MRRLIICPILIGQQNFKMEVFSHNRGHRVQALQDSKGVYSDWRYMDGAKVKDEERSCPRCGSAHEFSDHDHCIANLPNVKYACCGHGKEDGYVNLDNGKVIRFGTHLTREQIIKLIDENL